MKPVTTIDEQEKIYFDSLKGEEKRNYYIAYFVTEIVFVLKKVRVSMKLTQKDIANRMGVKQAYISKIENMEKMPGIETIAKYLYALNFTLDESKLFIEDLEKSLVKAESELRVLPTFVTRFSQKKSAPVYGNGYSTSSSLKLKNL